MKWNEKNTSYNCHIIIIVRCIQSAKNGINSVSLLNSIWAKLVNSRTNDLQLFQIVLVSVQMCVYPWHNALMNFHYYYKFFSILNFFSKENFSSGKPKRLIYANYDVFIGFELMKKKIISKSGNFHLFYFEIYLFSVDMDMVLLKDIKYRTVNGS